MRRLLHPFEIALQRSPDERPEFQRSARTIDQATLALDRACEQLRQQRISGELVLIGHDYGQGILQGRQRSP
jgi:hypothetical protein